MKTITTILLFLFLSANSNAQTFGTGFDWAHDIVKTNDGGFIIVGYKDTSYLGAPVWMDYILKMDSDLNEVWSQCYVDSSGSSWYATSIANIPNTNEFLVISVDIFYQIKISRINEDGIKITQVFAPPLAIGAIIWAKIEADITGNFTIVRQWDLGPGVLYDTIQVDDSCNIISNTGFVQTNLHSWYLLIHPQCVTGIDTPSTVLWNECYTDSFVNDPVPGYYPYYFYQVKNIGEDTIAYFQETLDTITNLNFIWLRMYTRNGEILNVPEEKSSLVNVYPNPSNGNFTVDVTDFNNQIRMEVINISSQIIYSKKLNNSSQKVSMTTSLSPGIYFIRLYSNNVHFATKKLIINGQ